MLAEGVGDGAPVLLEDPASLDLIAALTSPRTLAEAAEQTEITPAQAKRLAEPLLAAGVLVDASESAAEHASVWSFHDRLLHARTRPADRSDWDSSRAPPPALPERAWEPAIALERPDLDAI